MIFFFYIGTIGGDEETQDVSDRIANDSTKDRDKKFACKAIGCGRKFATEQKLNRHRKFKCTANPFTCERCQQSFLLNIMLRTHRCPARAKINLNPNVTPP